MRPRTPYLGDLAKARAHGPLPTAGWREGVLYFSNWKFEFMFATRNFLPAGRGP